MLIDQRYCTWILTIDVDHKQLTSYFFLGSGPLDVRIKRLAGQRDDLQDTVRRLKLDLEEERGRASLARGAADLEEAER